MREQEAFDTDPQRDQHADLDGSVPSAESVVLIVDDDATARLTLAAMLHPLGVHIAFAGGADEARRTLDSINPDVIVCDVLMDGMRGDEFFQWVKAHPCWHIVPIVAVTQVESPLVKEHLLQSGADSVVFKPCDSQLLRAHVRGALRMAHRYAEAALQVSSLG